MCGTGKKFLDVTFFIFLQSVTKPIITGRYFKQNAFLLGFFLLSETDLDDSTSSILSPSQPVCTEAAIISENLEFGWFRVVCCFSGNNFLRWKLVKLISSCLEQTAKNVDPFTM